MHCHLDIVILQLLDFIFQILPLLAILGLLTLVILAGLLAWLLAHPRSPRPEVRVVELGLGFGLLPLLLLTSLLHLSPLGLTLLDPHELDEGPELLVLGLELLDMLLGPGLDRGFLEVEEVSVVRFLEQLPVDLPLLLQLRAELLDLLLRLGQLGQHLPDVPD